MKRYARFPNQPLARFRLIYDALNAERGWWGDVSSLRFAAIAAIGCPGEPEEVAAGIRRTAESLRRRAGFFGTLSAQIRFVMAALLLQNEDNADAFLDEVDRVRELFRAAGLRREATYETMAILLLRTRAEGAPIADETVRRVAAIYEEMKRHHWWLTGPDDFAACALLACEDESPAGIGEAVEAIYQAVRAAGFSEGDPLQGAANILYLARLDADLIARRFAGLAIGFRAAGVSIWQSDYDELAILSYLNHPTQRVIDRVLLTRRAIESLTPKPDRSLSFNLAASVTFLELVQLDEDLKLITDGKALLDMQAVINAQQAATIAASTSACAAASAS